MLLFSIQIVILMMIFVLALATVIEGIKLVKRKSKEKKNDLKLEEKFNEVITDSIDLYNSISSQNKMVENQDDYDLSLFISLAKKEKNIDLSQIISHYDFSIKNEEDLEKVKETLKQKIKYFMSFTDKYTEENLLDILLSESQTINKIMAFTDSEEEKEFFSNDYPNYDMPKKLIKKL